MTTETRTETKPATSRACRQCGMSRQTGKLYYAINPDSGEPAWVCSYCEVAWATIRGHRAVARRKEAERT